MLDYEDDYFLEEDKMLAGARAPSPPTPHDSVALLGCEQRRPPPLTPPPTSPRLHAVQPP
ncbi:Protein of unknown function [Gryllus bimaculatus]|nr:Protein of unknown function [Gryllus bimaculatus]